LLAFQSDIIDSKRYRKNKKLRLALFGIAFIILAVGLGGDFQPGLLTSDLLTHEQRILLAIALIVSWSICIPFIIYTYKLKKVGKIVINEKSIDIFQDDIRTRYKLEDIDQINLMIKTIFTRPDSIFGYSGNNWIMLDENLIYEFKIDSHVKFKRLDKLVQHINQQKKIFHYIVDIHSLNQKQSS